MKSMTILVSCLSVLFSLPVRAQSENWTPLLNKNLSRWENYLSYAHKIGYDGKIPKDSLGNSIQPIGYNKDLTHVFSVTDEAGGPILRISGEKYRSLFTRQSYKNYHLRLQVKWIS